MKIEIRPLHEIFPYEKNARKIPQRAVDKVAASLQEFGWQQPIVVDKHGVIIVGHVRRLAALQLGWTEAPVHVAEKLTPAQIRAYRLMDNRSHEEATWDLDSWPPSLRTCERSTSILASPVSMSMNSTRSCAIRWMRKGQTKRRHFPPSLPRGQATCGSAASTACCAAMRPARRRWRGCSANERRG